HILRSTTMPLYEYECGSCGERFERIQKFSDPPLETCPNCGGLLRKLVSSPAFHLKGSGWYATDYAKKTGEPASTGDKPASSGKDDKDDKKDDKKDEKKVDKPAATSGDTAKSTTTSASSSESSTKPST